MVCDKTENRLKNTEIGARLKKFSLRICGKSVIRIL